MLKSTIALFTFFCKTYSNHRKDQAGRQEKESGGVGEAHKTPICLVYPLEIPNSLKTHFAHTNVNISTTPNINSQRQ